MKKITVLSGLFLILTIFSHAQFNMGLNTGYSIGKAPTAGLELGYNFKDINFHTGFIAHMSNKVSTGIVTYVKAGHSFDLNSFYLTPSAGYAFVYRSADNKSLNSSNLLLSGEFGYKYEFREQPMALYFGYANVGNNNIILVGLKGFF